MDVGMNAVVYCGSMGDWPLLTTEDRQNGVKLLVDAGVKVVVGTGAQNPAQAAGHARHAQDVGAHGLMVIPRVLSRGTSSAAQRHHFAQILSAAPELPAVIYNSPYYGFETKADLFFDLRKDFKNLVGFKEFGGADSLSYAGEFITHADDDLILMAGVDTQVYHGFVHCGARGAITGIGNCIPEQVLQYVALCEKAAAGDIDARRLARELEEALTVLSNFRRRTRLSPLLQVPARSQRRSRLRIAFLRDGSIKPKSKTLCRSTIQAVHGLVGQLAWKRLRQVIGGSDRINRPPADRWCPR